MSVYLANHYSERLLNDRACRLGSIAMGTDIATLGESTRNPSGYLKGKAGRRRILQRMWSAFLKTGDDNGIPDTGDVLPMFRAAFPDLPDPTMVATRDFGTLWAKHDGYAISWALDLTAVPSGSVLLKYVNRTAHQMVTYPYRKTVRVMDPWKTHSPAYHGLSDKDLRRDIRTAAQAINNGVILAELYPVGGWTAEALVRSESAATIERLKDRRNDLITSLRTERLTSAGLTAQLAEANKRIEHLESGNGLAAGWEKALVAAGGAIDDLRTNGPE